MKLRIDVGYTLHMSTTQHDTAAIVQFTKLLCSTPQGRLPLAAIDELERLIRDLGRDDECSISITEARDILGITSELIVPALMRDGQVRCGSAIGDDRTVLLVDILHERWVRESVLAVGGDDLSPEELQQIRDARPGTNPWERTTTSPSA